MQKCFVFDVNKCTGCEACQLACQIENLVEPGLRWRGVHTFNPRRLPGVPFFHLSLACNHCVDPPCMKYCPALAYSKDAETGAVTIDEQKCIGCKYCSWACPYDAPQFNRGRGTMEKCTFCAHRIETGGEPACAALCPTGALRFEDCEEPVSRGWVPGFTDSEIGPAVRFVPPREPKRAPVCSAAAKPMPIEGTNGGKFAGRIGLRSEWTLVVFTFVAAILVGGYASLYVPAAGASFVHRLSFHPLIFLVLGVAGMAISTLHLGRPERAWRAVLNWRRSWLSREVLLFSVFLAAVTMVTLSRFASGDGGWIGVAAGLAGFAALFSMDRVYHVTRHPGLRTHSAQLILTGMLFAGLFSSNALLFGLVALAKTIFYFRRKYGYFKQNRESRPWLTRTRILIGTAAPMVLLWKGSDAAFPAIVAGVIIGELIDRCEFYLELDAPGPANQMIEDLERVTRDRDGFARPEIDGSAAP